MSKKKATSDKAPKKPLGKSAGGTRQRIVLSSIALFNRHGVQSVTIERICSDLKISPGNLTYYFPRKDDLIRATVEALQARVHEALQRPVEVESPRDGAAYLVRLLKTFWDFRFYFNALAFLMTDNPKLRKEYDQLRRWMIDTMVSDLEFLSEQKYFAEPVTPNTFRLLAENIYGLLLNWLRTQQIENPSARTPPKAALKDVTLHLWSLCQHWMAPAFAQDLLTAFDTVLSARTKT
ncbi:MAG: TetR/AcrR family transcriptional regulator [Panacagrimonas sp.]